MDSLKSIQYASILRSEGLNVNSLDILKVRTVAQLHRLISSQKAELHKKIAPAGVPVLWCGGSALAVPIERETRVGRRDEGDDSTYNRPIETVMSLQPVEKIYFWPRGEFWLPLPK